MPRQRVKRIHVNQHLIRQGADEPLTVKVGRENLRAREVAILDDAGNEVARIVYSPDKPLSCGAKCWVETHNEIKVLQAS